MVVDKIEYEPIKILATKLYCEECKQLDTVTIDYDPNNVEIVAKCGKCNALEFCKSVYGDEPDKFINWYQSLTNEKQKLLQQASGNI